MTDKLRDAAQDAIDRWDTRWKWGEFMQSMEALRAALDEPVELPTPVLTHVDRDRVVAAIRYAVRGATMCGKETDFDPDALVQNAVYALCGPYSKEKQND